MVYLTMCLKNGTRNDAQFCTKTSAVMFSLTGATKYKYVPNYQDMRGGYDKLCSVVRSFGSDPEDGTAYVFTSKDQKLVKIIRHEHNQSQYKQTLDSASAHTATQMSDMERKEYQDKIRELLQAVTFLLDQNKAMGERLEKVDATIAKTGEELSQANDEIEALKSELKD